MINNRSFYLHVLIFCFDFREEAFGEVNEFHISKNVWAKDAAKNLFKKFHGFCIFFKFKLSILPFLEIYLFFELFHSFLSVVIIKQMLEHFKRFRKGFTFLQTALKIFQYVCKKSDNQKIRRGNFKKFGKSKTLYWR